MKIMMKSSIPLCLLAAVITITQAVPSTNLTGSYTSPQRPSASTNSQSRTRASPLQLTVSGSSDKSVPNSFKVTDGANTKPVLEMSGENNSSTPMDPAVMKVLSRVLETLESIRDARTRELNQASRELDTLASTQKESSSGPFGVSTDQFDNKKKPIIKKTYGYKVTVYATPLNGSKDDATREDLEPAGSHNHGVIHAYGNPQVAPYQGGGRVGAASRGGGIQKASGGGHHQERKELEDKGYSRGEKNKDENVNHEEKDRYYHNTGGHVREAQDIGHNRGEFGHDRGAANEKGLKEKTQIEYFERERGQEEEEVKDAGKASEGHHGQSGQHGAGGQLGTGGQYYGQKPHYGHHGGGQHYVQTPYVTGHHVHGQNSGGGGQRANAHDLHKRRKNEGLKERGFKITVEREVYLRDGFHDKGFGRHDQAHHKELAEKGHHKINQGDTHKHLTKEVKEHEGFDKGYGVRQHESLAAEKGATHLNEQHGAGHIGHSALPPRGGVTYVSGEGDQHYSPSNDAELAASVVKNDTVSVREPNSLKDEYNRAKVVPTIAENEEQIKKLQRSRRPGSPGVRPPQRPRRPQVPPPQAEAHEEDEESEPEDVPAPPTRPRRPPPPKDDSGEDIREKPRQYLPKVSLRAPRVRGQPPPPRNESRDTPYGNSFLDSITPPTGEDRFAFNVPPKKDGSQSTQVRFPSNQDQPPTLQLQQNSRGNGQVAVQPLPVINLYIPNNGNQAQDHRQTHYDLHAYPQSNEVPRPNPDLDLIRRHRVYVPKELSTYQKLGFSQPVSDEGQVPVNNISPGVWYAPTVIDHKK